MKKVAAIITEFRHNSHAEVIVGRMLGELGYHSSVKVVSMYTDQVPDNDMSRLMAEKHGFVICGTIEEAVTFGAPDDPVDGIVIIGEHGDYPWNEKNQRLYPRRRLLEQTLQAMDKVNLRVPIFCDKHFSYDNDDAMWMFHQIQQRNLPFLGGSSVPYTLSLLSYDLEVLHAPSEIFVISFGGTESYGFHGMEVLQSVAEQRKGGETGVESVEALSGDEMWEAMDAGVWPEYLLLHGLSVHDGERRAHPRDHCKEPVLFLVNYKDGTKGYVAQLEDYVKGWSCTIKNDAGDINSAWCNMDKGRPHRHFSTLTNLIERMIYTGKSAAPMERTLFTTIMINSGMEALYQKKKICTPELDRTYSRQGTLSLK